MSSFDGQCGHEEHQADGAKPGGEHRNLGSMEADAKATQNYRYLGSFETSNPFKVLSRCEGGAKEKEDDEKEDDNDDNKQDYLRTQSPRQHRRVLGGTQTRKLCAYAGGENALALCRKPVNTGETIDLFGKSRSGEIGHKVLEERRGKCAAVKELGEEAEEEDEKKAENDDKDNGKNLTSTENRQT
jgi:hypothetical protein